MIVHFPDAMTVAERRRRLRDVVERLAIAIDAGEHPLSRVELEEVAVFCQDYFLPVEAATVRRWIAP